MERNIGGFDQPKGQRHEVFIRWMGPREGWVRLNTDGAAKGNPGRAGAGGITRGYRGELHEAFAMNCGICSCTKAELLAVMRGLLVAWNGGHRKVHSRFRSCCSYVGGRYSSQLSIYSHCQEV